MNRTEQSIEDLPGQTFPFEIPEPTTATILRLDQDGLIRTWNASAKRMFGYAGNEAIGRHFSDLFTPLDNRALKPERALQFAILEDIFEEEGFKLRKDGLKFQAHSTLAVQRDELGELSGFVFSVRDDSVRAKAETELRISEEKYRLLYEHNPLMIFTIDSDGVVLAVNSTGAIQLGYDIDELIGQSVLKVFFSDDKATVLAQIKQCFKHRETISTWEIRKQRKDGRTIWVKESARPIDNYGGKPAILIVCEDITDRKLAEEAVKISEQKYRNLFESANDAVLIFEPTKEEILEVNTKATELYGFHRDELMRMSLKSITKDVTRGEEIIAKALREGRFMNFVTTHFRKDGFPLALLVNGSVIQYGGRAAILTIIRDVSQLKQTQDNLEKSLSLLHETLEATTEGILVMNIHQEIVTFNKKYLEMWEMAAEEIPAHDGNTMLRNIANRLRDGENFLLRVEELNRHPSNDSFDLLETTDEKVFECVSHPQRLGDAIIGRVWSFRDITQQVRANQQLQTSHEQLRALSSHLQSIREEERIRIAREIHDELGQVLTAVKMDLTLLDKQSKQSKAKELRSLVHQELQSVSVIIDGAIESVRRIARELRPEALDHLGIKAAIEWYAQDIQSRTNIECIVASNVEEIELEPHRATELFRIFQEAMTNILRHARASSITIQISQDEFMISVSIQDDGIGFDENQLASIRSLGIIGMRERTILLNGEIVFRSKPNNGTCVHITIPVHGKSKH